MKRILSLLIIIFTVFLIIGCEKEDEELVFRDQSYDDMTEALTFFASPQYEDLEFEGVGAMPEGQANMLLNDEEANEITTIIFENGIAITMTVYLHESTTRQEMVIEEIDIAYIDHKNKLYIELWFYKDNILDLNETFTIQRNYLDFIRGLRRFTINDYQELLYEIGYREVKNQT